MSATRGKLVLLPPNRVWRSYAGGGTLDALAGRTAADANCPEDGIASTTCAINAGREHLREGQSTVTLEGAPHDFTTLLASDPDYFLGAAHTAKFGAQPHLLVAIQEPNDLVVRCEFERGGYVLPESARFMNRGLEFCLDSFDCSAWSAERLATEAACPPRRRRALGPDSYQDDLIGPERTRCFSVRQSRLRRHATKTEMPCSSGIVTAGACTVEVGGETHHLQRYDKFFCPAGLGPVRFQPAPTASLLECYPPV